MGIKDRGFASMDKNQARLIQAQGGKAEHKRRGFSDPEVARRAAKASRASRRVKTEVQP